MKDHYRLKPLSFNPLKFNQQALINQILFCLNNGSQLGWLVDSEDEFIVTFQPNQQP